jgi:uncharacterized membrane protein YbhN (UPF0104 family)
MRKFALIFAKLALSVGLIWFAFSKLDAKSAFELIGALPLGAIAVGLALLFSEFVIGAQRLHLLLAAIGSRMGFWRALDTVLIGVFFSQTLISFVGGDAMRVWRMTRYRVPVGDAARAVLYDRVFGFLGLIVLIVLGLPLLFQTVADGRVHAAILLLIATSVAGCVFLLSLHLLPASLRRWRIFAFAATVSDMGHELIRKPMRLALLLALSTTLQALNVLAIYAVAVGLDVRIDATMCLVLIPPVIFLSMMPISFAGWGVREGAMVAALSTVGVPPSQALALSISYGLGVALLSLSGGVLWLLARRPRPHAGELSTPSPPGA